MSKKYFTIHTWKFSVAGIHLTSKRTPWINLDSFIAPPSQPWILKFSSDTELFSISEDGTHIKNP